MRVLVHFTGGSFIAFNEKGERIKERSILEQIAFEPFPGFKSEFWLDIPDSNTAVNSSNIQSIDINIDT